jgi:mRNA-degrading endonuclease RelE of RelBE toxin-antitoxin system
VTSPGWDLVVAGSARRGLDRLAPKVAIAVLDFLLGALITNPHRVGKALLGDLAGLHSARVGAYRVNYEIDTTSHIVRVIYIDHRADVYRPR